MEDEALLRACRPGVAADEAFKAALLAGAETFVDTGPLEANYVGRLYARRLQRLDECGALRSEATSAAADLALIQAGPHPASVSIRILATQRGEEIYTALFTEDEQGITMRACFWHEKPNRASGE